MVYKSMVYKSIDYVLISDNKNYNLPLIHKYFHFPVKFYYKMKPFSTAINIL